MKKCIHVLILMAVMLQRKTSSFSTHLTHKELSLVMETGRRNKREGVTGEFNAPPIQL